jgi:hypothetical protein
MNIRGFMIDLARSRRADLDHLKECIRLLAELDYNMVALYLEHRFDYPSCPGIAPPGSLTPAMARELSDFSRRLGVDLVPSVNVLGHCEGLCATERYAHLACDPYQQAPWGGYEQLNLELPEARELVRSMVRDICEAFPGPWLNVGGDEVRHMKDLFPGDPGIHVAKMIEHFRYVLDQARSTGRRVMVFGDMLLHYEDLMKSVPRDIWIMDWHYGPDGSRETLEQFKREGFHVLAMPAVSTCSRYAVSMDETENNLRRMIGDAAELEIDGFLTASWEFGFGSGFHLVWPWVAFASELAKSRKISDADAFLADFAARRYNVDGKAFVWLHRLLDTEFAGILREAGCDNAYLLCLLRKGLFRGVLPFLRLARTKAFPENRHQAISDVSPFLPWLLLRPILDTTLLERLSSLASEAGQIAASLTRDSRIPLLTAPIIGLAEALTILLDRVRILELAKGKYHTAAQILRTEPERCAAILGGVADALEEIRPGLDAVRGIVKTIDEACALDFDEYAWIDLQEKSLDEHIAVLRNRSGTEDSLLEFGAFLMRPASVSPRLTWR